MNTKTLLNQKTIIALSAVIVMITIFVGYQLYTNYRDDQAIVAIAKETITAEEFAISFSYPSGENALSLVEPPIVNQKFKKAYILMSSADQMDFFNSKEARETPASISVFVYELEDIDGEASTTAERPNRITRLQNWAKDNTNVTSFNVAKATPDIVEIDGVKALHYRADGLYQQDIYLASYRGNVYMFTAQYNEETDITFTGFQELIASVSFD